MSQNKGIKLLEVSMPGLQKLKSPILYAVLLFCISWVILVEAASLWFLFCAVTWIGRSLAVAGCVLGTLPYVIWLELQRANPQDRPMKKSLALGSLFTAILVGVILNAPTGETAPGAAISQRWTHGNHFQRFALTNIIPEIEQINMGLKVMPYLDPYLTIEQAGRVSIFTLDLYREMDRDPDFWQIGSTMGWAYADFLSLPFDNGHYYLYVPHNRPDGALPAIVFLHGSLGNFKAYTWAWAKLAEEKGYVIISPSFGFGNWRQPGGTQAVLAALEDAKRRVNIDASRVYLAGLSNGGLGVSLLGQEHPQQFRGMIFLSPVMVTEIVDQSDFQNSWKERPILVITGEADERIPFTYVEERTRRMVAGGISVTSVTYPGEDHFLFFSQLTGILNDISLWLASMD